jgi:hypothetical protein
MAARSRTHELRLALRDLILGAALLALAALTAGLPAAAAPPINAEDVQSESDYARAFDRLLDDRFSKLVDARDTAVSTRHYTDLVASFTAIEDALYAAYSPHANTLPRWYEQRLLEVGLGSADADFLTSELESGDFDRVVHAYYLASRSELPLVRGEVPTQLWRSLQRVARMDPEDRYWISLALTEASLLPFHVYDRLRTKMATKTESVQERIGKNADWLGARIPRVLGIDGADEKVSHPRIRYAREAARRRVRAYALASLGGPAAYTAVSQELTEMESGEFESRRFLAIMREDLPMLLERFGLPDDPKSVLETIRFLCRGRGSNRMTLWDAADDLGRTYEARIAAAPEPAKPPPPPSLQEIVAMGAAGAHGYLESALRDSGKPDEARRLFALGAIPGVVAKWPPADPKPMRRAIRDAYHALGYPNDLRVAYQRALDALGPEESAHAATSREKLTSLQRSFESVRGSAHFERAFADYREASADGQVPRRDVDPAFVRAFTTAAVRVLTAEAQGKAAARARLVAARNSRQELAQEIETAETAIVDANRRIREANEAVASFEEAQQEAIAARNEAVEALNEAVERAETVRRTGSGDFEAARAAIRKLEAELDTTIEAREAEAHAAASAASEAEQRGIEELTRARREEARARSAATRENDAGEAEREASTALHRSEEKFAETLGRLIAGLGFVGVNGEPAWVGDPDRDEAQRLAGMALLLEDESVLAPAAAAAVARERDGSAPALRTLAELTLEQQPTP